MPNKTLPSSTGYFNKKMLDILEKGEKKPTKKTTAKSSGSKTSKSK